MTMPARNSAIRRDTGVVFDAVAAHGPQQVDIAPITLQGQSDASQCLAEAATPPVAGQAPAVTDAIGAHHQLVALRHRHERRELRASLGEARRDRAIARHLVAVCTRALTARVTTIRRRATGCEHERHGKPHGRPTREPGREFLSPARSTPPPRGRA